MLLFGTVTGTRAMDPVGRAVKHLHDKDIDSSYQVGAVLVRARPPRAATHGGLGPPTSGTHGAGGDRHVRHADARPIRLEPIWLPCATRGLQAHGRCDVDLLRQHAVRAQAWL